MASHAAYGQAGRVVATEAIRLLLPAGLPVGPAVETTGRRVLVTPTVVPRTPSSVLLAARSLTLLAATRGTGVLDPILGRLAMASDRVASNKRCQQRAASPWKRVPCVAERKALRHTNSKRGTD